MQGTVVSWKLGVSAHMLTNSFAAHIAQIEHGQNIVVPPQAPKQPMRRNGAAILSALGKFLRSEEGA
jgi:hypothetical protein